MDESSNTQNRRSRRSHMLMTATLEVSGRAIKVKLRNLSADGAQVEGDQLPVEGTELLFRKGDLAVAGLDHLDQGQAGRDPLRPGARSRDGAQPCPRAAPAQDRRFPPSRARQSRADRSGTHARRDLDRGRPVADGRRLSAQAERPRCRALRGAERVALLAQPVDQGRKREHAVEGDPHLIAVDPAHHGGLGLDAGERDDHLAVRRRGCASQRIFNPPWLMSHSRTR